jgi:AcrR family transcriptional regulator
MAARPESAAPGEARREAPREAPKARRKSAAERREELLAVALERFAEGGYHGTSTEVIARDAGISHPYLFRLFRTKKELFLACDERACDKVIDAFRRAAAAAPEGEKLTAMGHAYTSELLPDRHALLMMMQGFAAASDPEIQERVRDKYGEIVSQVAELSGAPADEVFRFFAHGMLLNIITALDLRAIAAGNPVIAAWAAEER